MISNPEDLGGSFSWSQALGISFDFLVDEPASLFLLLILGIGTGVFTIVVSILLVIRSFLISMAL